MKMILACDPSGGIGYRNGLPWGKLEGDLARFKRLTENQTVLMGRKTWESLPRRPLPNRRNVVITTHFMEFNDVDAMPMSWLSDEEHAAEFKDAWVIGGAMLATALLGSVTEIHLSRTHIPYPTDVGINLKDIEDEFELWHKEKHLDHDYEVWRRKL